VPETGKHGWLFEAKKHYGPHFAGICSLRGHSATDCCLLEDFFEGAGEVLKEFGTQGPINAIYRFCQRLSEAALESGMSRIYGGIHFMSANLNGLRSGAAVGNYVFRNFPVRRELRSGD